MENKEKIQRAIFGSPKKPLKIGNLELQCYVLENGTRVLSGRGMQGALGLGQGHGALLKNFLRHKALIPYINSKLAMELNTPLRFIRPGRGGRLAVGYEATILPKICDIILEARDKGSLTLKQLIIAKQCEILTRGLATVGIIALVDEATGYQDIRIKGVLNKILNQYLLDGAKKYQVTFPLELYKIWFKLNNWEWTEENAQKRPGVIGKWTNKYIYERMAPNLLNALEKRNPKTDKGYRRYKHFQFLTDEVGEPKLREFFGGHIALGKATTTWRKYTSLVEKAYPMIGDQLKLDFDEDD